jgi:hypothetical protein
MRVFGNHIQVSCVEECLTKCYNGVRTFEQECVTKSNDYRLVLAKLEYVGWVVNIQRQNYEVLNLVVLLCNCVNVNYIGNSATMK